MDAQYDEERVIPAALAQACGVLTAGFGLSALVGWMAGIPLLSTFGQNKIPMAPSTALLFLLYGSLIVFHVRMPQNRRVRRLGILSASFGMIVSLLLFFLSSFGIHSKVEHLGFQITGTINGAPIGHMSPVTAFCFTLAGLTFLLLLTSSCDRRKRIMVAVLGGAVTLIISTIFLVGYILGGPLLSGSEVIPSPLTTNLAFFGLVTALILLSGLQAWPEKRVADAANGRATFTLILIFILTATGLFTAGYLYFRNYQKHFRAEVERQLIAIAELKVNELAQWRGERLGDASIFFHNAHFNVLVQRFLTNPEDAHAHNRLRTWLDKVQAANWYDRIFLLDSHGVLQVSVPEMTKPVSAFLSQNAADALRTGQIIFLDFHRDTPDDPIHLLIVVPLIDVENGNQPLGVLVLYIDPETYLYPFITRWPTLSQTAETLLVRRDGNDALYLNEFRHKKNTALVLRSSLDNKNIPAVKAALGQEGIVEGTDYRGVPVIAAVYAVPDSPWFLVARMDVAEINAPLWKRLWELSGLIVTLLVGAGVLTRLLWWDQRARFYRQRYEAAEALSASEIRYRRLFEAAKDGILILDAETGMILDVNPFLCELLGYAYEKFLGKRLWELGYFKDIAANQGKFEELLYKKYVRYEDLPLETIDGRWVEVEFVSNIYQVNHHNIIQCNIRDITERKRVEEKLKHSENLYRSLVDNIPQCIIRKDLEGRFTFVDHSFCRLLGRSPEEIVGKTDFDFYPPQLAEKFRKDDRHVIETRTIFESEEENILPSGEVRYVHVIKVPIIDSSGEIVGVQCIFGDITNRKRAEVEHMMLEAQLRQMQKMEAVGRLAGGVAHDFNNLIMVIQGYADLLAHRMSHDSDAQSDIEEISKAAERAASITRQLLAFARKQTVSPVVLDLNHSVSEMLKMLQRLIGEDIDLVWKPSPDLWQVKIDPSQLDQVLANLAVNARDAIAGVGKVTIETTNASFDEAYCADHAGFFPGEFVQLAVSDDGCGMDKETLTKIFEPFFTTKGIGKGTGLGLATIYGIVKQNDGYINVYSEPGEGTTFKIYLPRCRDETDIIPTEHGKEAVRMGTETALIVEDDRSILNLGKRYLEGLGYTVLTANTPNEAIRQTEEYSNEIHLLITDVIMPEMNGRELAERLVSIKPEMKCLYMSGYTANVIAHHGVLEAGVHFVQKPFSMETLAAKVGEALERTGKGWPPAG
ncbi:MAG: PAS domain S-box protein [Candidatus Omnitrophota bacterium]|jgi:PAS domain S-box-containing protein|nr:MAG: PAS domain S-box protein [Candidatus Omnitrophota bacterium]